MYDFFRRVLPSKMVYLSGCLVPLIWWIQFDGIVMVLRLKSGLVVRGVDFGERLGGFSFNQWIFDQGF